MAFSLHGYRLRSFAVHFKIVLLLVFIFYFPLQASAASSGSFKTQEYWNSTGLDFIHAADAYAMGYTGAGITLGVIDTPVRFDHPELAGKMAGQYMGIDGQTGQPYIPKWEHDTHGSHVAGIMAALRNDMGMHGVAFDASLVSAGYLGVDQKNNPTNLLLPNLVDFFAARPEIRVINNSWGSSFYPSLETVEPDPEEIRQELEIYSKSVFGQVIELAINYDKVIVFAGGNDTKKAPSIDGALPRYMPELKTWLNVISLDIANITTASDGTRTISPTGVSSFSNLGYKASLWSVSAPGSSINSLDAANNGYTLMGGTSMAAPYVSGALGLVQQAFPWMTGKQMADTILTTADNTFDAPDHLLQYSTDANGYINKVVVTIVDNPGFTPSLVTIESWIDAAYASHPGLRDFLKYLLNNGSYSTQNLEREDVFGQGLLDVGKAVRGIARLDANRMTAADVVALPELGSGNHALETFNTQGYSAEFSNDITQRKWDDTYHHVDFQSGVGADGTALDGLDVGLRKTGAGLLVLSGTNNYAGATVVDGGGLAISKRSDGTGGVLQNSDVLVRQGGTLLGDGEIQTHVVNSGTVAPGYRGLELTVADYTQNADGTLQIGIAANKQYSVLKAANAAFDGALRFSPTPGFYSNTYAISANGVQAASYSGTFSSVGMASASPTLGFDVVSSSSPVGTAAITQQRAYNAYSRYADSATTSSMGRALYPVSGQATGDMQNLFQALDWTDASGSEVAPAMEQLSPASYDAVARAGLEAQRQLNMLLVQRFLGGSAPLGTASGTGMSSGDAASGWQAWALPFGSYNNMNANGGSAGFTSSGAGLALGVDRQWDSGLTAGFDVALSGRRTYMHYAGEATAKTLAASVGGHAHFKPSWWDGGYVMGMARVGFEDVDMKRTVNFNGYLRNHDSRWTGLTTDFLAGGGKDWSWAPSWGGVEAGPLGWLEYSLSSRPGFTEDGAGASALKVDAATYDSLSSVLGAHAKLSRTLENGTALSWDTLAGWRHDWLDGSFHSDASFKGYDAGFESQSDIPGRDAMLVQTSLRATHTSGFFAQVELGAEFFRSHSSSCSGGISFGLEF
ncbi:MAG: S8 family serine peptidase [Desulfovibrio sp.]|uniref:S8 family serine peptidase n=1 Tax=Desulfovibrio sp. TaxID=885 RepID=UPI0039E3B289